MTRLETTFHLAVRSSILTCAAKENPTGPTLYPSSTER